MAKTNQPVSSFGSELQSTLRAGADRELRLVFEAPELATRFAQRINQLRAAMKREGHRDWEQVYRCGVHKDHTDPCVLIIAPKDSEFRSVLRTAGVDVIAPPPISEVKIENPPPGEEPTADSFLATLREETKIPPRLEKAPGKIAICSRCGRDLDLMVPDDADPIICFSCDNLPNTDPEPPKTG